LKRGKVGENCWNIFCVGIQNRKNEKEELLKKEMMSEDKKRQT